MKYIILVGDGMADYPLRELDGKTPLQVAKTPNMDFIAQNGILGLARTVPEGFPPGSDVANLSIFGYSPEKYYSGRAPLEAVSMGIKISEDETAFRCNLVTIKDDVMEDFTAGHISSSEAKKIISLLHKKIGTKTIKFYPGVSYRHLMVIKGKFNNLLCTPPHDITGQKIKNSLPHGDGEEIILKLIENSKEILLNASVNKKRISENNKPASMIWLWGYGKDIVLPTLKETYGLTGGVITAVDLIKGIGKKAGLKPISVPGATGYLDTNYKGKVNAAIKTLKKNNFVFVHVEAPDEAGHEGKLNSKIKAIEDFDSQIVGPILEYVKSHFDFRIIVLPDHPTPVSLMTHTSDPVPFAIMGNDIIAENYSGYDEVESKKSPYNIKGDKLIEILISGNLKGS